MHYQDMTVMAQTAMHNLGNSITSSIGAEEMDNKRIPSPQETDFVRFFGRTMAQWQIAFFLLETEARKSHQVCQLIQQISVPGLRICCRAT
jgi:hypothetical protein